MSGDQLEKVEVFSSNIIKEKIEKLKELFPEVLTEGRVDFDKLRFILGDMVDDRPERYSFTWAGKREAIRLLQTPSRATLKPDRAESVDFDNTQNTFIEGDNLEVLKLLYRSYSGQIKMIYIDPPYNTGNDFVYADNYADPLDTYLKFTGQKDGNGNLLTSNPETSGRYHSTWFSMIYPRLFFSRQLLSDDGLIFVSINDTELHNLRLVMNEIFGEENFVGQLVWQSKKGGGGDVATIVEDHEYVVIYAKQKSPEVVGREEIESDPLVEEDDKGPYRRGRELNKWGVGSSRADRPTMFFPIPGPNGEDVYPIRNDGTEGRWRWGKKRMYEIVARGDALFVPRPDGTYIVYEKIRATDPRYKAYRTYLTDVGTVADGTSTLKELFDGKTPFSFPKPVSLIKHLLRIGAVEEDDLVMDFFAGSCTTAQAVLELNHEDGGHRRFIMVQLPEPTPEGSVARQAGFETVAEIGKERIRRVIANLQKENRGRLNFNNNREDLGFKVFKLAESNFRQWEPLPPDTGPEEYVRQMRLFVDPLLEGWKPEDVIYEVALKEGYSLTSSIERVEGVVGAVVWRVSDADKDQAFYICLDTPLTLGALQGLNLRNDDLLICRSAALDDTTAANLALQCRLKTI
ncbi:MAG: site-specific DNA-methyltransferase [Clostridia bacterium]|nr:MAG: site-specific DNA-methyltransferase [Clostridia bacterium]